MRLTSALGLVVVAGLAIGCQDNKLQDQNRQLTEANVALRTKLGQMQGQLAQASKAQAELAARDARIKQLEEQLKNGQIPGMEGLDAKYNAAAGELTVSLPDEILFDSGSATLKASARESLDQVAAALGNQYADKPVRVEGFTDSDPVIRTKKTWLDNLDLSLGRAAAVTRYLEKQGVEGERVTTSGFGEHHQLETKAKSRRVEIVVVVRQPQNQQ